jgi:acyl-homoserine lactone acylase PvdQ
MVRMAEHSGKDMPTTVKGLTGGDVTLELEPSGVIHIEATTMHDAFYAQGMSAT